MMPLTARDSSSRLLLVDDDCLMCERLGAALERRSFEVSIAHGCAEAVRLAGAGPPSFAVVDLKLPDGSGLGLIPALLELNPDARIVVLTGYGSIASAVDAIKLGAAYYLPKPVDADDVVRACKHEGVVSPVPRHDAPMSLRRAAWEHMIRVLHQHDGNVSATARALSMHRRTLQRKLAKRPVRA